LASTSWVDDYSGVVVLGEGGTLMRGSYDGYGRVFTVDGLEVDLDDGGIMSGKVKLVSSLFYEGESFSSLGKSHSDPGQGHFHDADKVTRWYSCGGFPSWGDYRDAYYGR
jgi:hypothetical protein